MHFKYSNANATLDQTQGTERMHIFFSIKQIGTSLKNILKFDQTISDCNALQTILVICKKKEFLCSSPMRCTQQTLTLTLTHTNTHNHINVQQ